MNGGFHNLQWPWFCCCLKQIWGSVGLLLLLFANLIGLAAAADDPSTIFNALSKPAVWKVKIEITPENIDRLREDCRQYVHASIHILDQTFVDVGIHLKGSGSFRSIDEKPGFTLDFSRFVQGQSLGGLSKIHLNNSVEDPSYLKEKIGSELFQTAQLPAPLVTHAWVELNGKPLGLYVLKEGFAESFLSRHFKKTEGHLYEPGSCIGVESPSKAQPAVDSAAPSELRALAAAVAEPVLSNRWQRLQQILQVDQFITFMALEVMIGHWDGYCLGKNNFRIYADPGSGKLVFLPTGMDQIFSMAGLPWKPQMAGIVARAILEIPEGEILYAKKFKSLLNTVLTPASLTHRVRQLALGFKPYLTRCEYGNIWQESTELCGKISEREEKLRLALKQPEPLLPIFEQEAAKLRGWSPAGLSASAKFHEMLDSNGHSVMHIQTGSAASASWRTTLCLNPGRYRFRGEAKVNNVQPLPFGKHQGVSLRVAGKPCRSNALLDTNAWEMLMADFEITLPNEEIMLVCELRARVGEVWFKTYSLVLLRLR